MDYCLLTSDTFRPWNIEKAQNNRSWRWRSEQCVSVEHNWCRR
jgi:hypothetical protein